jgi:large subunit ribosomal protein L17
MRHHNSKRKFGRDKNGKKALMVSLAFNLIVREKMKTTLAKAKELRPMVEKLVTRAKAGTPAGRRIVTAKLRGHKREVKKLFDVIAPRYADTKGGYTRVLRLGARLEDGAEMAIIEFV